MAGNQNVWKNNYNGSRTGNHKEEMMIGKQDNSKNEYEKNQGKRRLMAAIGFFLSVVTFVAGGFIVVGISGRYNLQRQAVSYAAEKRNTVQAVMAVSDGKEIRQEKLRENDEQQYRYNSDILTFLFMGINEAREADALFLLVINPREEELQLIPIDCNTMTEIDIYDEQGMHKDSVTAQIGKQYAFGDGGKESCKYQIGAIRKLFDGISINGYLAIDIDVIPDVIKLIDGMDGKTSEDMSVDDKLARQIDFLTEFIGRVKNLTGKDFTIPVKIYDKIAGKVVTDITVDEVVYLAALAGGYSFNTGQVIMIPGNRKGREAEADGRYDEFYVDEESLHELILSIFYE